MADIPTRLYLLLFLSVPLVAAVTDYVEGLQQLSEMPSLTSLLPSRDRNLMHIREEKITRFRGDQVLLAARHNELPPGSSTKLSAKFHTILSAVVAEAF
jgi:hypothetical protein